MFFPHEVDRILGFWDSEKTIKATVSGKKIYDKDLRQSSVMFIDQTIENDWIYNRLAGLAIKTNNEKYWFDLLGFYQELQLTRYSEGDFFEWHLDFGPGASSDRKLSMTIQLSEPDEYEGGGFTIHD